MKGALIMKCLLVWVIILNTSIQTIGQTRKRMLVPYESQETSFWCWAASIKMIMDFHTPYHGAGVTQCDLVKQLFLLENPNSAINSVSCCKSCGDGNCSTENTCDLSDEGQRNLSQKTMLSTHEGNAPARPDSYDLIFSKYGFSSTQQVNRSSEPIPWELVMYQIELCRPFIINISAIPTPGVQGGINGDHALVVTGYEIDNSSGTEKRGIYANDPWKPCCDSLESYFPYDIFQRTNANGITTPEGQGLYYVNSVLSIVHSIRRDTVYEELDNNCRSCPELTEAYDGNNFFTEEPATRNLRTSIQRLDEELTTFLDPPQEPLNLYNLLKENADRVAGYNEFELDTFTYQRFIQNKDYPHAPVQYIAPDRIRRRTFLSCLFPPRRLSKVVSSGYEIVDIVSANVDENLVSTLQKSEDGKWLLRKITTYTYIRKDLPIKIDGSDLTVNLNNKQEGVATPNTIPFSLIKYFPYQYEFFSFKLNPNDRVTYLAPADNYPELSLEKNTAYRESRVIREIRGERRLFERDIRRMINQNADILRENVRNRSGE